MNDVVLRCLRRILVLVLLIHVPFALANDHGGGAPESMKFTVNVGNPSGEGRFLQVEMVFDFASPEVAHHLSEHKPKVQHQIILLLAEEDVGNLQTVKGKVALMERIVEEVNHILHETPKTGVKEVFFTNFIIQ